MDQWVTSWQAAELLSLNSGHTILPDYVRWLAKNGKLESWTISKRTKLYSRKSVEAYKVKQRSAPA
jgi:hypothetical protein